MIDHESTALELDSVVPDLKGFRRSRRSGRVRSVRGTIVTTSLPDVHLGEVCAIERSGLEPLKAEVIGFADQEAYLMTYGRMEVVAADAVVTPLYSEPLVPCGEAVRGRVLDALGAPLDGGPLIDTAERTLLYASPPNPMERSPITQRVETGIRVLDGLLTIGRGQRVAILASAGVGKSTLLGSIVRSIDADAIVIALIGERGHEVPDFVHEKLGPEGRSRATIVVSTGDESALLRMRAAYFATAIAEAERRKGRRVVLMMDSVTRFARALREVGHALGEPLGRGGYPNTMFTRLPQLFERAGNDSRGSITGFYTVLADTEKGEDPLVSEIKSLLDGHIALSVDVASSGVRPAVDVLASVSRVMDGLADGEHRVHAKRLRDFLGEYRRNYDKIKMGYYRSGSTDSRAMIECADRVNRWLHQEKTERSPFTQTVSTLSQLLGNR